MIKTLHTLITCLVCIVPFVSFAQTGTIKGVVKVAESGDKLDAATIYLTGNDTTDFYISETNGTFQFTNMPFGTYQLQFLHLGFENDTLTVEISLSQRVVVRDIALQQESIGIDEVEVRASQFRKPINTPASIRSVGITEIRTNPGSGSDIAKVMQILPGVATTTSFRNDLIIRGGAPSENSFYVDGFRVPVINHLATQGASGGAVSILNADFIQEAELISGNFPSARSNALSSVFNFNLQDAFDPGVKYRFSAGATNLSTDAYGSLGEKVNFIGSVRRSYRQYILKLLGLAVYPVYNDFLAKINFKPNQRQEISLLGIGAIDQFRVNQDINDSEIQSYLVDNLPLSDQWNYTAGIKHRLSTKQGIWEVFISKSELFNKANREVEVEGNKETSLKYESTEVNNRIATEYVHTFGRTSVRFGGEITQRVAEFDVYNLFYDLNGVQRAEYQSNLDYLLYGAHVQFDTDLIPDKWSVSLGIRMDGSNYAAQLKNITQQSSPRISTTFQFNERFRVNGGVGMYYQLPGDLTLGYSIVDSLVNQGNVKYIRSLQSVIGFDYEFPWTARLSVEGFYKKYHHYPFNTRENISQANEGGDYGVAGNSPIRSDGSGRSFGLEILYEQKMYKNWFGTLSYTLSSSEFENANGELVPSSWDARHIVNAVIGRRLKNDWQIGLNVRYQSALPFTPFDPLISSFVPVWNVNREGIRDFSRLNTQRGKSTLLADLRIDKKWDVGWGVFTFYLDIENLLADADSQQVLVFDKSDALGNPLESPVILNPQDPIEQQRYKLKELQNAEGVLIPTFGFILDF